MIVFSGEGEGDGCAAASDASNTPNSMATLSHDRAALDKVFFHVPSLAVPETGGRSRVLFVVGYGGSFCIVSDLVGLGGNLLSFDNFCIGLLFLDKRCR